VRQRILLGSIADISKLPKVVLLPKYDAYRCAVKLSAIECRQPHPDHEGYKEQETSKIVEPADILQDVSCNHNRKSQNALHIRITSHKSYPDST
jgi:hypothetical protein